MTDKTLVAPAQLATAQLTMKTTTVFSWRRVFAVLLISSATLVACANGPEQPKLFSYPIQWNVSTDATVYGKAEVKVLDYAYGVTGKLDISPGKWFRDRFPVGGCCDLNNEGLVAPRGDYLYFKWRVLATGEVFEDRVDLSKRLPQDMNDRGLYVAIFGSQLYVYLFPPQRVKQQTGPDVIIAGSNPARVRGQSYQDTLRESAYAKQYKIYP